jgi:hypothetical protein
MSSMTFPMTFVLRPKTEAYCRGPLRALLGLSLALGISPAAKAQQTTLRFRADPTIIEVTFDAARLRTEDVKRWMQLRDLISNENGYQVPAWLEQCFRDDPRYVPCGGEPSIDINNARLNLGRIRDAISNLDQKRFPTDLSPVVLYLRRIQEFALWKETQRLLFFQTGNIGQLESPFQKINPKVSCEAALNQIRNTTDRLQASELARVNWGNCVWAEERKQIGPYPQKAWDSFVSAHGIHEHVFQEEID